MCIYSHTTKDHARTKDIAVDDASAHDTIEEGGPPRDSRDRPAISNLHGRPNPDPRPHAWGTTQHRQVLI
jgi:hypothetical protein